MKLGDVTIRFDEEQLKRFEAAANRLTTFVNTRENGVEPPKDPANVTIRVPLGEVRDPVPFGLGPFSMSLTHLQGVAIQRVMSGIVARRPPGVRGRYPPVSEVDAIRWLLDQIRAGSGCDP